MYFQVYLYIYLYFCLYICLLQQYPLICLCLFIVEKSNSESKGENKHFWQSLCFTPTDHYRTFQTKLPKQNTEWNPSSEVVGGAEEKGQKRTFGFSRHQLSEWMKTQLEWQSLCASSLLDVQPYVVVLRPLSTIPVVGNWRPASHYWLARLFWSYIIFFTYIFWISDIYIC